MLKIKSLKSQAALEFLTTYGWAFLVILIMIGTLAYFGILSPSKILPNRCNFGTEFQCIDYQITYGGATTGSIKMRLKNNVGEPISIDAGKITPSSESKTVLACGASTAISGWKSGDTQEITLSGCNSDGVGIVKGEKYKIAISIDYYTAASGNTYTKTV
ncbi:hypothetical protein HYS31_06035, partial [Candidatus Woesearchaeota archaeon]|nr:hypothetical protein [Candidatus Woesearchaeota archaeon]